MQMEAKDAHRAFLHSLIDFQSLYEQAPCGYLSFSAEGEVFKVNGTLLSWLGYTSEELVDRLSFTDLISRGGRIYYEMFYFPLLQMQSAVNEISFDFIRRDGSRFPALVNSNVVRSEAGELLVVNATVFDITDRKKYEHELLLAKNQADAERNYFEVLSDFLPEMIWTAGADGTPNYSNKRFLNFFSISSIIGELPKIMSRVFERDRHVLLGSWIRALRSGEDFQTQVRLTDSHGEEQWYLIRAVGLREGGQKVSKWMGSCTNINEHVTAIEKLDEFISIASHELRTPITTLKASLQLMGRFKEQIAEIKMLPKLIEQASSSTEKIGSLVTDLLNAGNIKEGQMQLQKTTVDVGRLLQGTCPHVSGVQGHHNLLVKCPKGLEIFADELRIDQVLVNFVNNAIKYAPSSKDILLIAEQLHGSVKISVRDTGPGISPEKLPRIFERYYRIERSGQGYSGLGLGLYICAEIVRRHGGEIGVDSEVGEGTSFWFTLPN
jgi:PAS domain S-box-containing protein